MSTRKPLTTPTTSAGQRLWADPGYAAIATPEEWLEAILNIEREASDATHLDRLPESAAVQAVRL